MKSGNEDVTAAINILNFIWVMTARYWDLLDYLVVYYKLVWFGYGTTGCQRHFSQSSDKFISYSAFLYSSLPPFAPLDFRHWITVPAAFDPSEDPLKDCDISLKPICASVGKPSNLIEH